jgi:predicted deacylase
MELFDRNLRRGEEATFETKVAEFPDGTPISITVRAIAGSRSGPRLAMLGVQHGDEYGGMEIINRLMDSLDPGDISGEIVAVPVSNPLAFNTAGRVTPPSIGYENLNLNRVWPGNPEGLLMERVAAALWDQVVKGSDVILDLHEGARAPSQSTTPGGYPSRLGWSSSSKSETNIISFFLIPSLFSTKPRETHSGEQRIWQWEGWKGKSRS